MSYLLTSLSFLVLIAVGGVMSGMPGAPTEERDGNEHAQQVADAIKPEVQAKLGANHELKEFVVEKFKTQVVAGTNYYLKIRTAPNHYIHARVFKPLGKDKKVELTGLEKGKVAGDKIGYIERLEVE